MHSYGNLRRYLVRSVLSEYGIGGLSLIEIDGSRVELSPFAGETHSTVFVPAPVAILSAGAVTEFLLDDIERILSKFSAEEALQNIDELLRCGKLYAPLKSADEAVAGLPVVLLLSRGNISILN